MLITIISLFPQIFDPVFSVSIIKRAKGAKKINFNFIDLRDYGVGKHKSVDDKPYGGGVGMVLRVDVLDQALHAAKRNVGLQAIILLDPKGEVYDQKKAEFFAKFDHLILVCGHYEGIDERARQFVDYEISIGDYILSGGEQAAMVLVDSITRLIPGVLKKEEATSFESFTKIGGERILEYPHYTRPRVYKGEKVPEELLSGNFKLIEHYRINEAKKLTRARRPDIAISNIKSKK